MGEKDEINRKQFEFLVIRIEGKQFELILTIEGNEKTYWNKKEKLNSCKNYSSLFIEKEDKAVLKSEYFRFVTKNTKN